MTAPERLAIVATALAAAAGCRIEVDYAGTRFACVERPDCPPGTSCINQVCVPDGDSDGSVGTPFLAGYTRRKSIAIRSSRLDADAADLVIAIRLTADAELSAGVAQADGGDIAFTADDGLTRLAHEIERYDAVAGDLVAWVRIDSLDADADRAIYVYYGSIDATDQQDAEATWSADVAGAWHLADATYRDSAHGNDASAAGSGPQPAAGVVGGAMSFADADDALLIGDPADGSLDFASESFSYSVWVNVTAVLGEFDMPWNKGGSSAGTVGYDLELGANDWNAFVADSTTLVGVTGGAQAMLSGKWTHLVAVVDRDAGQLTLHVDGVAQPGAAIGALAALDTDQPATIGPAANAFSGLIDEVRVYRIALPAERIAAEFASTIQTDFTASGPEEQAR